MLFFSDYSDSPLITDFIQVIGIRIAVIRSAMSDPRNRIEQPILLHLPLGASRTEELEELTRSVVPPTRLRISRTFKDLRVSLLDSASNPEVVILLSPTPEHLDALLAFRDPLLSTRLILVLPDEDKETIAKAHSLRPRFVSSTESGFLAVAEVLARLMSGFEGGQRSRSNGSLDRAVPRPSAVCPMDT